VMLSFFGEGRAGNSCNPINLMLLWESSTLQEFQCKEVLQPDFSSGISHHGQTMNDSFRNAISAFLSFYYSYPSTHRPNEKAIIHHLPADPAKSKDACSVRLRYQLPQFHF